MNALPVSRIRTVGTGGRGAIFPPYFCRSVNTFQTGGQIMPTTLILATPPEFQTFAIPEVVVVLDKSRHVFKIVIFFIIIFVASSEFHFVTFSFQFVEGP